jgi:ferric hydroxamate transport system permease protein
MSYLIIRLSSAFLVGWLLCMAGSFIQLSTRNILSSPSTLGMDAFAVLTLLFFHTMGLIFNWYPQVWWIFLALPLALGLGFIYPGFISGEGKFERVILIGITLNLMVGALFSLWQFLFMAFNYPFPSEMWFGHFRFAQAEFILILALLVMWGIFLLKNKFSSLMLFSMGPQVARNWELDGRGLFRHLFIFSSVVTFTVIGLFGAFSFLALLFPILSRKLFFGSWDLKGELVLGPIMSGLVLMLIDWACYEFPFYGAESPVGLIMSVIGAVSLLVIIWYHHKNGENLAKPSK